MWSGTRSVGKQDELERKQADLRHAAASLVAGSSRRTSAQSRPCRSPRFGERFSRALQGIVPYEPGKPVEEVQRELGLERVRQARLERGAVRAVPGGARGDGRESQGELNRYPDGGAYRLRAALAERHGVAFEEVAVGAGADGLIDCLSQASSSPATRSSAAGRRSRAT